MEPKLLFEEESYKIIGACIQVHKKLGNGFGQGVYEEVLEREFEKHNIPFEKEKMLDVFYDGLKVEKGFLADFVCYDKILVEVRTLDEIAEDHRRRSVNALRATQFQLGLLVNFGEPSLKWKRLINTVSKG